MSENSHEETIRRLNKAQAELRIRLEQVSDLRVGCAKLQLELLKLYKPQCLQILEMLRDIGTPSDPTTIDDDFGDDGDAIQTHINEGGEVLGASEDVSVKSTA